jgi:very-short-patch-repair endonuclease
MEERMISNNKDGLDWMRPELWKENEGLKERFVKSRNLARLLDETAKAQQSPKTHIQKDLKEKWEVLGGWSFGVPLDSLKRAYLELNEYLNQQYRLSVAKPTTAENRFLKGAESVFNRTILRSQFIGPFQCDFLIMGIRFMEQRSGLVIEVDGGCHDRESKMLKDNLKHWYLREYLEMGLRAISNDQVYQDIHLRELESFNRLATPSSRAIKRKWRKIISETLAFSLFDKRAEKFTKELLEHTFQLSWVQIEELVEIVKYSKSKNKFYSTAMSKFTLGESYESAI